MFVLGATRGFEQWLQAVGTRERRVAHYEQQIAVRIPARDLAAEVVGCRLTIVTAVRDRMEDRFEGWRTSGD